jgi:hypothetical protein
MKHQGYVLMFQPSLPANTKFVPLLKGTLKTFKTPSFVRFAGSLLHAPPLAKKAAPFKKHCQNRRNRQNPFWQAAKAAQHAWTARFPPYVTAP